MLIVALLVAASVGVLGSRPPARRLAGLRPREPVASLGLSPTLVRVACAAAALAVWGVVGGALGVVVGLLALLLGPRALATLNDEQDDDAQVAVDLPLALDLLAACLSGGAVAGDAVRAVAAAVPGPCGDRLGAVGARLAVGTSAAEAWRSLGHDRGPAGAAARAMSRAAVGGAPVAAVVQRVAEDARRESAARAHRAARRAGVLVVAPLGLCFLPAFLLLGVVPAVIGLAAPLVSSL